MILQSINHVYTLKSIFTSIYLLSFTMFTVLYADQFESSTPPPPAPLGIPRGKFDCVLYPGIGEPELDLTSGIAEFVRGYFLVYWS